LCTCLLLRKENGTLVFEEFGNDAAERMYNLTDIDVHGFKYFKMGLFEYNKTSIPSHKGEEVSIKDLLSFTIKVRPVITLLIPMNNFNY
jgi:uncharacterized protein (UPF0128 family)